MLTERFASHAALAAFYRRLLESPNFLAWFERRRGAAWAWQVSAVVTSALHSARGVCKLVRKSASCAVLLPSSLEKPALGVGQMELFVCGTGCGVG